MSGEVFREARVTLRAAHTLLRAESDPGLAAILDALDSYHETLLDGLESSLELVDREVRPQVLRGAARIMEQAPPVEPQSRKAFEVIEGGAA